MDALWDSDAAKTAMELRDELSRGGAEPSKELATTTVLTVLSRLEHKGFVSRDRATRPHLYRATTGRADHKAELMHEILGTARDRDAVLARFVGQVSADDARALRRMLDGR